MGSSYPPSRIKQLILTAFKQAGLGIQWEFSTRVTTEDEEFVIVGTSSSKSFEFIKRATGAYWAIAKATEGEEEKKLVGQKIQFVIGLLVLAFTNSKPDPLA